MTEKILRGLKLKKKSEENWIFLLDILVGFLIWI